MFSFSRLSDKDIFIDINEPDFKSTVFYLLRHSRFPRKKEAFKKIIEREDLGTTALGHNIAIPHCRLNNFRDFYLKFALFKEKPGYIAQNNDEIKFMFLMIGPQDDPYYCLRAMSRIARVISDPMVRVALLKTENKRQIKNLLCAYGNKALEQKVSIWK